MRSPLPVVLVYQMGKVGSMTVYETLRGCDTLRWPVHHVHCLSPLGLAKMERYTPHAAGHDHVKDCTALKEMIDREYFATTWKIITLVREPVGLHIASFFENLEAKHPELRHDDGTFDKEEVLAFLDQRYFRGRLYPADWFTEWFDRELRCVFGIDVYEHAFDHKAGFGFIRKNNVEVAVVRLENLSSCLETVIEQLTGISGVEMRMTNTAGGKGQGELVEHVKRSLRLAPDRCDAFYGLRMARHFYSQEELAGFRKRWCRE